MWHPAHLSNFLCTFDLDLSIGKCTVAHCCQSKKIKIKITKNNKNENKIEKMKKYSEKNHTKLSWPMSAKSDT